jgi:predicted nucleic acid-binding protein
VIYCDSAYILKFYIPEEGSADVRLLFEQNDVASCCHAQAEVVSAMHRKWRDNLIEKPVFMEAATQFKNDIRAGCWEFFNITQALLDAVQTGYRNLPSTTFLRASDALHLACAKEHGFREIYSNDKHLLAAAKLFGLKGRNVIK